MNQTSHCIDHWLLVHIRPFRLCLSVPDSCLWNPNSSWFAFFFFFPPPVLLAKFRPVSCTLVSIFSFVLSYFVDVSGEDTGLYVMCVRFAKQVALMESVSLPLSITGSIITRPSPHYTLIYHLCSNTVPQDGQTGEVATPPQGGSLYIVVC